MFQDFKYTQDQWDHGDSDDNAASTATKAAVTGKSHYISKVTASYSVAATSGLLQIKEGTTVVWERYIHGAADIEFPIPLKLTHSHAANAVLAASGTGGQVGKVYMQGYTAV